MKSTFDLLNEINVNEKTEQKNGLTYLSWAWAWAEVKKLFPNTTYTVYENANGWNYFTDGKTGWVKTGVTIDGQEYIEYLPIMDYKNKSIPLESITSFDVNKTIQRSLTKALARHGLGLYIYAGEDLPESNEPLATKEQLEKIAEYNEIDRQQLTAKVFRKYNVKNFQQLTQSQATEVINTLIEYKKRIEEAKKKLGY